MFDIEAFVLNHGYFVAIGSEDDHDEDVERNVEILDRIDGELEESDNVYRVGRSVVGG